MHQGPQFDPKLGLLSVWSFTSFPSACLDFLRVLQFPYTSKKYACRWIGYANLLMGVTECECVCMVPYDGLVSHPRCAPAPCPVFPELTLDPLRP